MRGSEPEFPGGREDCLAPVLAASFVFKAAHPFVDCMLEYVQARLPSRSGSRPMWATAHVAVLF